jgi:hypothetical protein
LVVGRRRAGTGHWHWQAASHFSSPPELRL